MGMHQLLNTVGNDYPSIDVICTETQLRNQCVALFERDGCFMTASEPISSGLLLAKNRKRYIKINSHAGDNCKHQKCLESYGMFCAHMLER